MQRVLAHPLALVVPGVSGMNARRVVFHVAVPLGSPEGREGCGSRRSYSHTEKRERNKEISEGAKQPHEGKVMSPSAPRNRLEGATRPGPCLEPTALFPPCNRGGEGLFWAIDIWPDDWAASF